MLSALNTILSNIAPIDAPVKPEERWILGYEGVYSIGKKWDVYSYKNNVRTLLKSDFRGRVTLFKNGTRRIVRVEMHMISGDSFTMDY